MVAGTPIFLATKAAAMPALPPEGKLKKQQPQNVFNVGAYQTETARSRSKCCATAEMSPEEQTTPLDWLASCTEEQRHTASFYRSESVWDDTSSSLILGSGGFGGWGGGSYLLAEMSDATDLEGARGL